MPQVIAISASRMNVLRGSMVREKVTAFRSSRGTPQLPRWLRVSGPPGVQKPPCRNPRPTVDGYGDFDLRPMSAMARPMVRSAVVDADRRLCCAGARCCRALRPARRDSVGGDSHHGRVRFRCRKRSACGLKLDAAMSGHGAVSRFVADACGGPRGCFHRSNTSMTIMRPPQHGHGGR